MRWMSALFVVALVLPPAAARAQQTGGITGVVTAGDAGQPLVGVSVSVVGTDLGAVTSEEGRFLILNVPTGSYQVTATLIGYATQTLDGVAVPAGSSVAVSFELRARAIVLDEIVAVGYGTQRREEITSAVASVASDQFIQGPALDAGSLIAGKLPGLIVTTSTGDPTEDTEISLRGVTTLNGDTDPLVLIDGVPGSLETIPAQDIESISVLKDGSAGAIYGSRASNGVILITTKQHTGGEPTFRYSGYVSYSTLYNSPDFLTAADFRRLEAEGKGSSFIEDVTDGAASTDWLGAVLRQPVSYRHNLSISGGSATTNYTASLDYENTQGIFLRSDNRETTGRINIGHSMYDGRLTANVNLVVGVRQFHDPVGGNDDFSYAWRQALIRNPTDRMYDENGDWQERDGYFYTNPLLIINERDGQTESRNMRLHGTLTLSPIDNFRLSLLAGTTRGSSLTGRSETFNSVAHERAGASRSTGSDVDRILQLTGTYDRNFGSHNFSLLAGYDYQDFRDENFSASNSEFPTDQYRWYQLEDGDALADGRAGVSSGLSESRVIGFFGRLNYDWQNRYLLTGSVRYEGNSKFGANHKWGVFPAVSAGWRISQERFMESVSFIDELKLRAGYGITGIAPNGSYRSLASFSFGGRFLYDGRWIQTLGPSRNANPDLRWERKDEINVGVDFALFSSRLYGSLDVYQRNTRDMLYNYDVPSPPFPVGSIEANVGHMKNNGIEALVNFDVLNSADVRWTSSVNGSTNSNELVSLSNDVFVADECFQPGDGHTGEPVQQYTHRVCVGDPIGNFFGYESVDVTEGGEWIVLDSTGAHIPISEAGAEDRRVLGNGIPKYYLAWNNFARIGNFDLSMNMRGAFGFQILNYQRMFYENPTISYNLLKSAFDPVYGKAVLTYPQTYVSYYIEDGAYWKLDNVTVGYTLGAGALGVLPDVLSSARIYVSGRNLLTLTGYKGMDPEVSTGGLAPGSDERDQYPTTRMFTMGVNLAF